MTSASLALQVRPYAGALVDAAQADLAARTAEFPQHHGASWPLRVATEFAPAGLLDGAWLQGAVRANVVENDLGMIALQQLMMRFSHPGVSEGTVERYSALLRSIGVAPASVLRWEADSTLPCADISYEHALLGVSLGLFPSVLEPETLGFNLWMAAIGPCPLLEHLQEPLRNQDACLRYFEMHDRATLTALASQGVARFLEENSDDAARVRIARGFAAAHRSYRQWETAMLGSNVPVTARDFVLEMIKRKAPSSIGHHGGVRVGRALLEDLVRQGDDAAYESILEHLEASPLIRPGDADASPFLARSISFDGPMFDVFTRNEQRDLREWIHDLGRQDAPREKKKRRSPVQLEGKYTCPQDPESLREYAFQRYGDMAMDDLYYYGANSECNPAIVLFTRSVAERFLSRIDAALADTPEPEWSERDAAEMLAEHHRQNVVGRAKKKAEAAASPPAAPPRPPPGMRPPISLAFDGVWLQGFLDVHRSDREEYGWMFRIYASEHGDGILERNHNYINRRIVGALGEGHLLPATSEGLYRFFGVSPWELVLLGLSLNTRHFMPELLGLSLAIEAKSVGGAYLEGWKSNQGKNGNKWLALTGRLHNSIDNFASGHTKWSLAAAQSFLSRVESCAPSQLQAQWRRIWKMWKVFSVGEHGTPAEREALGDLAKGLPYSFG